MVLIGFAHVARYWHGREGCGIGLLSCGDLDVHYLNGDI